MAAPIELRDYQVQAVEAVRREWAEGRHRTLLVLPTGAGKTIVFASIVKEKAAGGGRALVLAHTEELVEQAAEKLRMLLSEKAVGIVRAEQDDNDKQVVVATVQTLRSPARLDRIGRFDLIVIDEAHHAIASTYRAILDALGAFGPGGMRPLVLGVTATPDRGDGHDLTEDLFQSIAFEVGIEDMIRRGYLTDIRAKRIALDVNLDRVARRGGDFVDGALGSAMVDAGAPDMIAAALCQHAADRRSVVFVPTVSMAEKTAKAISAAGLPCRAVSGETPRQERHRIIEDVRAGRLCAVTNALVLTEGFDAPVLDCAVMARPTASRALYQQSAGRVLRPYLGKPDALILDVVGVTSRLSLHSAASLLDTLSHGEQIRDGETAMEAIQRVQEAGATEPPAFSLADGRLVAFDVDLFDRSRLNWITTSTTLPILSGARTAYAIRMEDANDRCELFRLDAEGYGYRAVRLAAGLSLDMAQGMAEDAARRSGIDPTSVRDQPWRRDPPTPAQLRKLWAIGVRDRAALDAIRTKGDATDAITRAMVHAALMEFNADDIAAGQAA